jgi:hypothetical protein
MGSEILKGSRSVSIIQEGQEPAEFWATLGGKSAYFTTVLQHPPQLFQCSTASGSFQLEEVFLFCQDSLDNNDMMILDGYTHLFVWMGLKATEEEKRKTMEVAMTVCLTSMPTNICRNS